MQKIITFMKDQINSMRNPRVIVFMGLFIAMEVVLTRFVSIQTPIVRIGFGFLPIALSAIMFGPVIGGITAMLCDLIGATLFPKGAFFPGFTLSALLGGVIYGIVLYRKQITVLRVGAAVLIIKLFVDLGLNTIWLSILYKKAIIVILPTRLISNSAMFPIQTLLIFLVWRYVGNVIQRQIANQAD
jgi:ECF transporter S component (folate family)